MTEPTNSLSIRLLRVFGSKEYFRLWQAQFVTSLGDWLGLIAIAITAQRVGSEAGLALVIGARVIPGLFLGQIAGVLADRWNRYRVMMFCDFGRAAMFALLPFVDTVWQLVLASLIIEAMTLLWIPSKEALLPSLIPKEHIATANSLSLGATYGTFPIATAIMLGLTALATELETAPVFSSLRIDQESLGFYANTLTFICSGVLVISLAKMMQGNVGTPRESQGRKKADFAASFREFAEGWRFIVVTPLVRAVNFGLATALLGAGLLIPLGVVFNEDVLGGGTTGYSVLATGLGSGVAVGVVIMSIFGRRITSSLDQLEAFMLALAGASVGLIAAATFSVWIGVIISVSFLGFCGGVVYVLGFTLLHTTVEDDLRGRVFSGLYSLIRICLAVSLVAGTLLSALLSGIAPNEISLFGVSLALPGVRLTLWLGGLIIGGSALFVLRTYRQEALQQEQHIIHETATIEEASGGDGSAVDSAIGDSTEGSKSKRSSAAGEHQDG